MGTPISGHYSSSRNLSARIRLHQRFSTNRYGWMRWAFDQFGFRPTARVLELGCGTGALWRENAHRIRSGISIVVTDASEGMLRDAGRSWDQVPLNCRFAAADALAIPFRDRTFDAVIANHMLYHVADIDKALRQTARVLKSDGAFYATTNGVGHLDEIPALLKEFDRTIECPLSGVAQIFSLEHGADQLRRHFARVELRLYPDSLEVTEAGPLVEYVLSLAGTGNVGEKLRGSRSGDLRSFLSGKIRRQGSIRIAKHSEMFIATGVIGQRHPSSARL